MKITAIVLWTILCVTTGGALFKIAFEVEQLEESLAEVNRDIAKEQEALRILEAEWAYLTRPSRIGALSQEFFPELGPPAVEQITTVSDTPLRTALPFELTPSTQKDEHVDSAENSADNSAKQPNLDSISLEAEAVQ